MAKIVGVVGWIGTGKDTVADYLVNNYDYKRESFAGTLKDAVAAVFGWPRDAVEGATPAARAWRETEDKWWADRLGMPGFTPRLALQLWGTEVCRNNFHDDIWIASLQNKLRHTNQDVVISDVRFPNEVKTIKDAGGKVVWVQRGPKPDWFVYGADAAAGINSGLKEIERRGIHASEWAWLNTDFDEIINNSGTLDSLYRIIDELKISNRL